MSSDADGPSAPGAGFSPARQPIIVLVRPQLGENIGAVARAMGNFGITRLRLVAPRDGWPNPAAGPSAAGADAILEQAELFDTTAEAVADCAHIYATTVRKRGVTKPVLTPAEASTEIHAQSGESAILFGPERSGLEAADVDLARTIVTIPVNPDFASLNLAQAVIVTAYEWAKGANVGAAELADAKADMLPPAPQAELDGLVAHIERLLEPRGYFLPAARAEATKRTLRNALTQAGWSHLQVRTLRGVLASLEREPRS